MTRLPKIILVSLFIIAFFYAPLLTLFSGFAEHSLPSDHPGGGLYKPMDLLPEPAFADDASESASAQHYQKGEIFVLQVDGVINPVVAGYVHKGIGQAHEERAGIIIMELDTPGGLDKSMRQILKDMFNSEIPIVVFVAPSGSRAASAGTFITLGANVAAMAPGTNIGAAHPVQMGGEMAEDMRKKVENDAAAYIKSVAEKRQKNAEWAEKAVRESVSISEKEALELKVIDLIALDLDDLIEKLNGREVQLDKGLVTLQTKGRPVKTVEMTFSEKILDTISDPTLAYMLLMLGFYGLFFELTSPGAVLPGIFGAISLILGLYSLQTLSVNYAGLLLMILALIMFLLEIKVTSYGALTLGGIISMILGSLMLFDSPDQYMRVSLKVIIPFTLGTAGLFTFLVGAGIRALRLKPSTGFDAMIGESGLARTDLNPDGTVLTHGELWKALSKDGFIEKGESVEVIGREGFTLHVKKRGDRK